MAYPTFLIEKKDLEGGLVHPKGTLLLKLSGNNAMKSSIGSLVEALKLSAAEVIALYRFENPYSWFLVPTTVKVPNRGGKAQKLPYIGYRLPNRIVEIMGTFAEQGSKVEVTKIGASDK
ncbi:neuropeptide FF receptor 1 [Biomphalaria glabrata]|nr:neuropeptide FF receptor 1 [Biomphalaria glabrata]